MRFETVPSLSKVVSNTPYGTLERLSVFSGVPLSILRGIDDGSVIPDEEVVEVLQEFLREEEFEIPQELDDYAKIEYLRRVHPPENTDVVFILADELTAGDYLPILGFRGWVELLSAFSKNKKLMEVSIPLKGEMMYTFQIDKSRRLKVARHE